MAGEAVARRSASGLKVALMATGAADSSYDDVVGQALLAERAGFHAAWFRERHFLGQAGRDMFPAPLAVCSYLAARTKRIRLGVGCRILSLDQPLHVAEDAATVDVLSGGRLDFGIARTGENALYQQGFGIAEEETRPRFCEALEVILKAWSGEPFRFRGRFFEFPEVLVQPRPVQRPHPPIYVVALSQETRAMAARYGFPLIIAGAMRFVDVAATLAGYREQLAEAGHDPDTVESAVNRFVFVGRTVEEARRVAREALPGFIYRPQSDITQYLGSGGSLRSTPASLDITRHVESGGSLRPSPATRSTPITPSEGGDRMSAEELFEEVCIFGDAASCAEKIDRLRRDVGVTYLMATFNYYTLPHGSCLESMQRFVEEVVPACRD